MKNKKNIQIYIGALCRKKREACGILKSEMATWTGYCENNITEFEKGNNNNMILFLMYVTKCNISADNVIGVWDYAKSCEN